MPNWARWFFDLRYRIGKPPWDSGITPPEVIEQVEHSGMKPGRALDLGCGTGTNSIYLARRGFETVGVDFSPNAIENARAKARRAGVEINFYINDVTRLDFLREPFDLVLDIGCFHALDPAARERYADNLLRLTCPGAVYMLYAFGPRSGRFKGFGATQAEVRKLYGTSFALRRFKPGADHGDATSAWYWFVRA